MVLIEAVFSLEPKHFSLATVGTGYWMDVGGLGVAGREYELCNMTSVLSGPCSRLFQIS